MTIESPVLGLQGRTMEVDLACSKCSYNLKGLERSGNCPECGQPIEQTINFGLHCADPTWLKYQSVTMLFLAVLAVNPPGYSYWNPWYSYALRLIAAIIGLIGVWRLSRPDPAEVLERDGPWRRGLIVVGFINAGAAFFMPEDRYDNLLGSLSVLSVRFFSLIVLWWMVLLIIARLASRTQDAFLAQHARLCLWTQPGVTLLTPVLWLLFQQPNDFTRFLYTFMSWIGSVTAVVTVLLLGRMFEVLRASPISPGPHPMKK